MNKQGVNQMDKIRIALMNVKTGKMVHDFIEEVTVDEFEAMNEDTIMDKTRYKYNGTLRSYRRKVD